LRALILFQPYQINNVRNHCFFSSVQRKLDGFQSKMNLPNTKIVL
jgi:hypothetical protein